MREIRATLPTVAGLKPYQAGMLAGAYLKTGNWTEVKAYAYEKNVFDVSRKTTSDRYSSNLIKILSSLNSEQLGFVAGRDKAGSALLWLGFCLAYPVAGGFVSDVVCEKYRARNFVLKSADLWEYLADICVDYPNLSDISEASRSKAKSVIFTNLRDAGLLNGFYEIQHASLSAPVKEVIGNGNLKYFPGEVL